ncbi:MAG: hypothetical protein K5871_02605 [Lachnospiraceae bacterium]|nr:hypothetical protein [Lachnospiraceae bacterium]
MFVCPNCGANINFDPGKQLLHCDFCDTDLSPDAVIQKDDAEEHTYTESEADESSESGYSEYTTTIYTCKECGGEILANDNTVATFCSYCGASTVLSSRVAKERAPEYIIPFRITKDQSAELYKKAVSKALYAPDYMKEDSTIEKLRGIYMPYWIYDFQEHRPAVLKGQKDHRSGDYIIHEHFDISFNVDAQYKGLSYDASSQFSDTFSEAIAPFDFSTAVPFNTSYMSGFYADAADTEPSLYERQCRNIVTSEIYNQVAKDPSVRSITLKKDSSSNLTPEQTSSELGYFPVWFLSCRHKDRISYAVVNGQTGEVATDVPVDYRKYVISSLICAIPLALLFSLLPILRPIYVVFVAFIFAITSMIILCSQKNKIYIRENSLDDIGLNYRKDKMKQEQMANLGPNQPTPPPQPQPVRQVKTKTGSESNWIYTVLIVVCFLMSLCAGPIGVIICVCVITPLINSFKNKKSKKIVGTQTVVCSKAPASEKFKLCLKPLIGAVLALGVLIAAPHFDSYYYISALICIASVLLSFWDIIKGHNELATRKLPQFDKRGGDES